MAQSGRPCPPARYRQLKKELHLFGPLSKPILPLDGSGLKGPLTLEYLEALKPRLRQRDGNCLGSRISIHGDLIAGTSNARVVPVECSGRQAASLALAMPVVAGLKKHQKPGHNVFSSDPPWGATSCARGSW